MMISLAALWTGFLLDCMIGDPPSWPHIVKWMGGLADILKKKFMSLAGEDPARGRVLGGVLFLTTTGASFSAALFVCSFARRIDPRLGWAVESILCWQCIAMKSLKTESMKVASAASKGDTEGARKAVSMIVGRDTESLDIKGIIRAAVETVAENSSDGVIAPVFYMMIGGAPLGCLYKAVNTLDSMVGYREMPYRYIGTVSARADDIANIIPSRLSALLMLLAGMLLGFDVRNGLRIFIRDRYAHPSPNSAQTESCLAGLLGVRFGGGASYHGVWHDKKTIGDPTREIEAEDIKRANRLVAAMTVIMLLAGSAVIVFIGGSL